MNPFEPWLTSRSPSVYVISDSEMKAYKTLIENTPHRVDALVSLHLQWININDYEVEYVFEKNN